ncbi:SDR family NAD(P)-dependent oxidoreductase, partial [Staphylococcus epidermidis]|uniref:SDR family NAD(P)-dependent oxidoreductase n=1 Tax=Staphylococcus epidermidis TaxID=1282 RepID=UPI0037DA1795
MNKELALKLSQQLQDNAIFIQHHLSNQKHWKPLLDTLIHKYEPIHLLLNNPPITYTTPLQHLTLQTYIKILNINQLSLFLPIKSLSSTIKNQKHLSIINISS